MQDNTILHLSLQDIDTLDTHITLHLVSVTSTVLRRQTMALQTLMQAIRGLQHLLNLAIFLIHGPEES